MYLACYSDWNQLPESTNALFVQGEKGSVFFSHSCFECLAATALDHNHSLVLACVVPGEKVMTILPLMKNAENKTWYSIRHGFTPLYSLLLADDDHEQDLPCLSQALSL